jgi:hypothetical protein
MPHMTEAVIFVNYPNCSSTMFLIHALQRRWEREGLLVRAARQPQDDSGERVAILHLDISRIPEEFSRLHGYRAVINGRVMDITKRSFSSLMLGREADYAGPVIVKTDANCGGMPEFTQELRQATGFTLRIGSPQSPWRRVRVMDPINYPVFPSIAAVPNGVWANPRLIVERFMPEHEGDLYCLRSWVFLGSRSYSVLLRSPHPIVKVSTAVHKEPITEVPEELRHMRHRLGFDYGKFDYGIVEGRVILYDVNRTPTLGANISPERRDQIADLLAEGLYDFL